MNYNQSMSESNTLFLQKIIEFALNEDWENFCLLVELNKELMQFAFQEYYHKVPERLKRNFAIDCYINGGDNFGAVRKAIRELPHNIDELPAEFANCDYIVVYRAGEEPINKAKFRISWTIDKNIANFFLNRYNGRHATHLYKAKIRVKDIITYTNQREEKEILQYGKVYDIEEIQMGG